MRSVLNSARALAALSVILASIMVAQSPQSIASGKEELIPVGKRVRAPDFTLTDVSGKRLTLSRYRGNVVLLDFWATTCGGCKTELPWYVEFNSKYHDKGLSLIGLDMYGENAATIKPFMTKWHMNYPVAVGTDALGEKFGVREMPLTLLIDRDGRIAASHAGIVDRATFENDIQQLLQK
ncbi:redoxin domain-containing protein [Edaphobacter paludis]|uniref:Redoxin domain-containing protein n=1 Tax=Edaphobacter paludis TaxID=3035702 RepID=A0AAU7D5E9_9BACT